MELLLETMKQDWWVLLPIVLCSILTIMVAIDRATYYNANKRNVIEFIPRLQKELARNNLNGAQNLAIQCGGIIGEGENLIITDVENLENSTGNVYFNGGINAGGIAGKLIDSTLTTATNNSPVSSQLGDLNTTVVKTTGGIVGYANASGADKFLITDAQNTGNINYEGTNYAGGILGESAGTAVTLENVSNTGETITVTAGKSVGGVVGYGAGAVSNF